MIRIGVDYYPEHWDRSMWEDDARLMRESGVNVVRLAEFAWSLLEPEEGRFAMDWLADAADMFGRHGIAVVLGIPTMTPPHWLASRYPDVLPALPGQHLSRPGVRGHRCYNSPSLRTRTRIIANAMAERFAGHPAVIGWQTDNEFSLHMCRCAECQRGFRAWLANKYGTLERVNREWGTAVWSGTFADWEQIGLYETSEKYMNPSLLLDYRRFQSESVTAFQQIQVEAIRARCPDHFMTHNTWSAPLPLDLAALYEPLDFASFDYYPATSPDKTDTNPYSGALLLDRTRGIKRRNFWVMEQFGGPPGSWMPMWRSPHPGFLRAFAWQSVARGADGVVFFRWRSGIAGAEQFWHGLIDHSNVPGRRFAEFQRFSREAGRLSELLYGTEPQNEAAILYDFDSHTALQLQPQTEGLDYYEQLKVAHRAMTKLGIGVDIVYSLERLERYKLVVLPSLFVLDDAMADAVRAFVASGGTVVATPRTGVKAKNNQCHMLQLPGPLADCFGVRVTEYDPIGADGHEIADAAGTAFACGQWNDLLEPATARPIAWHNGDFYAGTPAATVNEVGDGAAYYIGTFPEERYYRGLFAEIARRRGIPHMTDLPEGVQMTTRGGAAGAYTFLLNLSRETRVVRLGGGPARRLLAADDAQAEGDLTLEPYGVEILAAL